MSAGTLLQGQIGVFDGNMTPALGSIPFVCAGVSGSNFTLTALPGATPLAHAPMNLDTFTASNAQTVQAPTAGGGGNITTETTFISSK